MSENKCANCGKDANVYCFVKLPENKKDKVYGNCTRTYLCYACYEEKENKEKDGKFFFI